MQVSLPSIATPSPSHLSFLLLLLLLTSTDPSLCPVYSWVNGSDQVWAEKKSSWFLRNLNKSLNETKNSTQHSDDTVSQNRFRDSEELRYSFRSLEKYAPWIRKIFLVTDNQVPYWLNLQNSRIQIISHQEIFPNQSHLPVFSSPAIETHLHRIPGLSKKFIYFNDDVFLGAPTLPEDFYLISGTQRLYQAWDVPKCAPGCSDSWIGDGYCDKACNVSSCNFDFPDCVNGSTGSQRGRGSGGHSHTTKEAFFCATGCPDSWLGDKVCDQKCRTIECGWDAGDCGVDIVVEDFPGFTPFIESYANLTLQKIRAPHSDGTSAPTAVEVYQNHLHFVNPSSSNRFHPEATRVATNANESAYLFPVALTVPYGTYAAYVNLSYLPCTALQISTTPGAPTSTAVNNHKLFSYSAAYSPTCSENDIVSPFGPLGGAVGHYRSKVSETPTWTNFTYTTLNYTIAPVNKDLNLTQEEWKEINLAVPFSILIIKHNLLMVLFRGHDKEFSDAGTPKKAFHYRQPLDVRFNLTGSNIVTGINVSALFSIRLVSSEPEDSEGVIDRSIPPTMGQVNGYSSSCLPMSDEVDLRDVLHIDRVHHQSSPFLIPETLTDLNSVGANEAQQGVVLSISIAGLSSELYETPLKDITSVSTVTSLDGLVSRSQNRLCESIAHVQRYQPTIKRERLGTLSLCDDSVLLGQLFYLNGRNADNESPEPLDLLLHVPIPWNSSRVNASGVGFYVHGNLELFLTSSTHTSASNETHEAISANETLQSLTHSHRLLCVGGIFRWGTRKILENPLLLNQTNTTDLSLVNANQTNSTESSAPTEPVEPEPKVDTYASSLRHVNSLYHKVSARFSLAHRDRTSSPFL
jgi:hypothetical protein